MRSCGQRKLLRAFCAAPRPGEPAAEPRTNFGFEEVPLSAKQGRVNGVFTSVARSYDRMNDVMSGGLHRLWKQQLVEDIGVLRPKLAFADGKVVGVAQKAAVLELAAGSGDVALRLLRHQRRFADNPYALAQALSITVTDINPSLLDIARQRISAEDGEGVCAFQHADAQALPFPANSFDVCLISFGLRNVPEPAKALAEGFRVLRPGGRFICMEFSRAAPLLQPLYRAYLFGVIPLLGQAVAGDRASYRYLAESIERFHPQEELLRLFERAGFSYCGYRNLLQGVVAVHSGFKLPQPL